MIDDVLQNIRIRSNDARTARAESGVADLRARFQNLELRHERLKLLILALWDVLEEKTSVTEADLLQAIRRRDMADGRYDGRSASNGSLAECSSCGRVLKANAPKCLYCSTINENYDPLDSA